MRLFVMALAGTAMLASALPASATPVQNRPLPRIDQPYPNESYAQYYRRGYRPYYRDRYYYRRDNGAAVAAGVAGLAAGALIARSRAQGLVMGTGGDRLRLEYVSEVSDVEVGDVVITSGIDGIYPKGFVIGEVESFERAGVAFRDIVIRPAVDFTRIEQVLVVLEPLPIADPQEDGS